MSKVLLIGEPMELLQAKEEGRLSEAASFGADVTGAELNVAVGITRLGLEAKYMSRLGNDPRAERIRAFMRKYGIADDLIIADEAHQTGCMVKSKAAPAEQEIHYYRQKTAASLISEEDMDKLDLSDIRAVFFTGTLPAASETAAKAARRIIERAKESQITVVFDPNLRGILWTSDESTLALLNEIAAMADIFVPNLKEAAKLCGLHDPNEIADSYLLRGTGKVVVTLGKNGAFYKSHKECGVAPTFQADEIVSTIGAGDGFAAGLLSGICDELPLGEAVLRANAVGAMQLNSSSDHDGLPTMAQLREYMLNHRFVVENGSEI